MATHAWAVMTFLSSVPAAGQAAPPAPAGDAASMEQGDIALRFFPVFDVQRGAVAALFCRPTVEGLGTEAVYGHEAFHDFDADEWTRIDCAILDEAVLFSQTLARAGIAAVVGATVSFATLGDPRGRIIYREALRAMLARGHGPPLIELADIPDATGAGRIGELVQSLKPLVPRLWVRLPGSHVPLVAPLHARGFVLSMPAALPMHGMQIEARWLARAAQAQGAFACMDRIATAAELDAARQGGIRFVAGPALHRDALAASASLDEIHAVLDSKAVQASRVRSTTSAMA